MKKFICASTMMLILVSSLGAQEGNPQEEKALQKRAEAFIAAFNKGDAKAVASFWTPDGDYIDLTGKHLKGSKAIEESFAKLFEEEKGAKVQINPTALRFVTPELAIEDGVTEVLPADGAPWRGRGAANPAARPQPGVLCAGPGDKAQDPHGLGGAGLARLLPRRRRADLRQA